MSPPNHQSEGIPEQVLNIILDLDAEANRRASAAQQPQQPGTASGLQPANHGYAGFPSYGQGTLNPVPQQVPQLPTAPSNFTLPPAAAAAAAPYYYPQPYAQVNDPQVYSQATHTSQGNANPQHQVMTLHHATEANIHQQVQPQVNTNPAHQVVYTTQVNPQHHPNQPQLWNPYSQVNMLYPQNHQQQLSDIPTVIQHHQPMVMNQWPQQGPQQGPQQVNSYHGGGGYVAAQGQAAVMNQYMAVYQQSAAGARNTYKGSAPAARQPTARRAPTAPRQPSRRPKKQPEKEDITPERWNMLMSREVDNVVGFRCNRCTGSFPDRSALTLHMSVPCAVPSPASSPSVSSSSSSSSSPAPQNVDPDSNNNDDNNNTQQRSGGAAQKAPEEDQAQPQPEGEAQPIETTQETDQS